MNGWTLATEAIGVYGSTYLKRATITLAGLGANPPEDGVYPVLLADSDGDAITGEQDYVIRFDADAGVGLRSGKPKGARTQPCAWHPEEWFPDPPHVVRAPHSFSRPPA